MNRKYDLFPKEIYDYMMEHHSEYTYGTMMEYINSTYGTSYTRLQIKGFFKRNKIRSNGKFDYVPWNKGMKIGHTSEKQHFFQKGHLPPGHKEIGSEVIRNTGYTMVKVAEPNEWRFKHHLVWEEAHGPIPDGYRVIFLDGDKTNCDIGNLAAIPKEVDFKLIGHKLRFKNGELTKASINYIKLILAIDERQKGNGHED